MDKIYKYWDNFNHSLYNEYINRKNQHLEEVIFPEIDISQITKMLDKKNIILYNDHVNTFDHVVDSLVSFCDHTDIQAEQCALIVHNNGKCSVMSGIQDELEPIASILLKLGLTVEIE